MSLVNQSIVQANSGLKAKKFSALELTEACLREIEGHNSRINAYVTVTKKDALESARQVDKKIASGESIGMLEGIPMAIKDIINVQGIRTTCGSPGLRDFVSPYDATVVSKLKHAGMVLLGKTNCDEFACGSSTEHSCFGPTRNPRDETRVAGGSSGGSAAAVAKNMAFYALGTDTGGSIREPASFCGIPGLKVTYGRVSRFGVTAMASSWDTVGHFARTVEDLAHVLKEIAGHDVYDSTTSQVKVPDYTALLTGSVSGLRIGVPKEYFEGAIDPEVKETVWRAIRQLETMGALVQEISLPMTRYAVALYYILTPAELSANLARFDGIRFGSKPTNEADDLVDYYFKQRAQGFGDEIKRRIMIGTYVLSAGYYDAYYSKAQKVRTKIIQEFDEAFKEVDVICSPVAPMPAFKIGEKTQDPLAMYLADAMTIPINTAGIPALAVPCGETKSGLPIGLQIMGPQFEEGRVLLVGDALEKRIKA
ncbi:MAG: glutamyl-tRNA(Gln) amidotransferase subunit A, aspartyl-tRNA(Asn)/glutamyl-tRNA (Gln) amidotransferase subunit A [Candidatus Peregrinibacteria bacterium GW2011_GWE2_39_6]|nr:MAG: glutamyl-tRNA(Gln) amidotransferase subunit A, aspartyl-tRNA(Asn)/glutamyl-tRNA (Gln) amidotransferase subunit A [Candidatus Peregrinibacteria bacterium GW2011_GWF2_39_17]KKR25964.1 MAG: glutamyl-tRNA(Gln) amidotransferase subunit A, aspartyl-tRNA(Asn)/glutamyl-tRNA (Gln) amidotransferase subunit A [Candidatus Peregrinibacteria bacterium GW2011_GWE2_39_6]HCW32457.1 Asp-tRNA(Asn)/Glu-tRNA(Gln) amidotransferase GatCAB subunit A [Candidatus Peregrinibacteria bacterium]